MQAKCLACCHHHDSGTILDEMSSLMNDSEEQFELYSSRASTRIPLMQQAKNSNPCRVPSKPCFPSSSGLFGAFTLWFLQRKNASAARKRVRSCTADTPGIRQIFVPGYSILGTFICLTVSILYFIYFNKIQTRACFDALGTNL